MSVNIKTPTGLQRIAGSTVILDATASEIRSGTFTMNNSPSGWCIVNITFDIPMPDTEYVVNIESSAFAGDFVTPWRITDKTVNGFKLSIYGNVSSVTGKYYAIRLVKLDGYTELQNKVNNPDSAPTENSTNLVESGGVYEMIKSASSVFVGTAAEWEDVTTKEDYQLAVITDKEIINSVDETTGDTAPVADFTGSWIGTTAEWEALSAAEKAEYKIVNITDDYDENGSVVKTYVSNQINVGSNTAMTFTFSETIPKGKYLMHFNLNCSSATAGTMNYTDEVLGTLYIHFAKTTSAISTLSADTACAITISSPTNTIQIGYSWASATTSAKLFLTRIG